MIACTVKVRPMSKGGSGPSAYLLRLTNARKLERDPKPQLLFGSPDHFERCVRHSRSEYPYTSYVLSYKGQRPPPTLEERARIHRAYLCLLRGGLAEDATIAFGVTHGDDEHGVLLRHLVDPAWPRFQPYYNALDWQVFSDFQWVTNRRYGLRAPENASGHQLVSLAGKDYGPKHLEMLADLREQVQIEWLAGRLNSHRAFLDLLRGRKFSCEVKPHPKAKLDERRVWIEAKTADGFTMLLKGPVCIPGFEGRAYRLHEESEIEAFQKFQLDPQPLWERFLSGVLIRRARNKRQFPKFMDDLPEAGCLGFEDLHPDRHIRPVSLAPGQG